MSYEHIAPEKADHTEDIDDRADDQEAVDIILSDRSSQLNEREHNSVDKIREQIDRQSDPVALLLVVVVADTVVLHVAVFPLYVAVIITLPCAIPFTVPSDITIATALLLVENAIVNG